MAVVGCGPIGNLHARAVADSPHATLVAVCDPDAARRQQTAAAYGVNGYEELAALLAAERLDAVLIATPDHLHVEPALAAIAAGCHVFCEKPLAPSLDDARRIVEAAAERGVRLGVDYNRRFAPGYRTAKELLDDGGIGKLKYCLLRVSDRTPPPEVARSPTVIFTTLLTHHFDLMRYYGGEIRSLFAVGGDEPAGGLLRSVTVSLQFAAGAIGTFVAGYRDDLARTSEWMELGGTAGSLVVEEMTRCTATTDGPTSTIQAIRLGRFEVDAGDDDAICDSIVKHVKEFLGHLAEGLPVPVTGRDGLVGLQLAEAAIESLATGKTVEVSAP